MTKLKDLQNALKVAEDRRNEAQKNLNDHIARTTFVICNNNVRGKGCGKKTAIRNLTFIQTLHYEDEPYCGQWKDGEGNTICPKCGHRIRLLWENEHVVPYKYLFKDIQEEKDKKW